MARGSSTRAARRSGSQASALVVPLLVSFAKTYLWPIGLLVLAWSVYAGVRAAWYSPGVLAKLAAFAGAALSALWVAFLVALLVVIVVAVVGYLRLRRAEAQ